LALGVWRLLEGVRHMCGRYTLTAPVDRLVAELGLDEVRAELSQNFNVAPTQSVAAVVAEGGKRRLELLRWGLVPSWADDPR
jgi:putative SOS response-associated peptidase YedK